MTSKLKCPFCETELEQGIALLRGGHILGCPKCKRNADDIFWFALIQAKQDLEIARKALKKIESTEWYDSMSSYEIMTFTAMKALETIGKYNE